VFEGLLQDDKDTGFNKIILDLSFDLATWHAYAKLRLHTEDSLSFFDSVTVMLGETVCKFSRTVCSHYHTTELPHEHAARGRRQAASYCPRKDCRTKGKVAQPPDISITLLVIIQIQFGALGPRTVTVPNQYVFLSLKPPLTHICLPG
jgi:hypothetical protein